MSTRKKKKSEKDQPETAVDVVAEELEKLKETEASLRKQIEELKDSNLRLHADYDNYRKRTSKERIELSKTASEEVIKDLLPVIDDMERALQTMNNNTDDAFIEGVNLIYNKMVKTLSSRGLQEIKALGQPFDTDFHEAISHFPVTDESQKNTIIDVVQKGYKIHDKVIRFAKVVVGA